MIKLLIYQQAEEAANQLLLIFAQANLKLFARWRLSISEQGYALPFL